jgi:hypothetical protein
VVVPGWVAGSLFVVGSLVLIGLFLFFDTRSKGRLDYLDDVPEDMRRADDGRDLEGPTDPGARFWTN